MLHHAAFHLDLHCYLHVVFIHRVKCNNLGNFCYLGDMLCAGGGCKLVIVTRCSTAWGKFKGLFPILTSKHMSLRTRGKVFNACVRSALLHGSETWAPTAPDLQRLCRNDRSMVRWICGVRDDDKVSSDSLCAMIGQ